MKVAFYKASHGSVWDWIVAAGTFGRFSHVELIFDDGRCFSSTPYAAAEGMTGVRFSTCEQLGINIEKGLRGEGEWKVIDLGPTSPIRMRDIERWCARQIGKPYDWLGIAGFTFAIAGALAVGIWAMLTGIVSGAAQWTTLIPALIWMATTLIGAIQSRSKWYCSKIVSAVLFRWNLAVVDRIAQSPNSLYRKLRKLAE